MQLVRKSPGPPFLSQTLVILAKSRLLCDAGKSDLFFVKRFFSWRPDHLSCHFLEGNYLASSSRIKIEKRGKKQLLFDD